MCRCGWRCACAWCPTYDCSPIQGVCGRTPNIPGIGSRATVSLVRQKRLLKMNGSEQADMDKERPHSVYWMLWVHCTAFCNFVTLFIHSSSVHYFGQGTGIWSLWFKYLNCLNFGKHKQISCFKKTTIVLVPKKSIISCLNDYFPMALTFIISKCFEIIRFEIHTVEASWKCL